MLRGGREKFAENSAMTYTIRKQELPEGRKAPPYRSTTSLFTIELHNVKYVNERIAYIDFCHPLTMSYDKILEMARSNSIWSIKKIYCKRVGEDMRTGLKEIVTDQNAKDLWNYVDGNRVVEVYIEPFSTEVVDDDVSDSDDSDYDLEKESDDGESELERFEGSDEEMGLNDDELIRNGVDVANSSRNLPNETSLPTNDVLCFGVGDGVDIDTINEGLVDSDECCSLNSSDSEDIGSQSKGKGKGREFTRVDKAKVQFCVGMKFGNADEFKEAVTLYTIQESRNVKYKRTSSSKISLECEGHCEWKMFASKVRDEMTFRITSLHDKHTCSRSSKNRHVKSRVIAKLYLERIKTNPSWKTRAFREHVCLDLKCKISYHQCVKALIIARKLIQGSASEQYAKLWDYLDELKLSNPRTTTMMKVEDRAGPNGESRFKCLYICWGSLKKGFVEGCRPVVGIDGCHLSGPYKGVLLTAVAIDPNNCMYPFAYAVVQQETTKTWRWFLKLLRRDLGIGVDNCRYTVISDKQKGLIKAVEDILPGIEHRFCVRHMYNNFKLQHKGMILKDYIWEAARATTMQGFEAALEKIKVLNKAAYDWVVDKPGINWSRYHFRTDSKCDILLNNLCESFNACILDARSKPILHMLELIRQYLMEIVCKKKLAMERSKYILCPKIQKKLEELKGKSHEWIPNRNGDMQFEVRGFNDARFAVDLDKLICGCRRWELTGIPCVHAIAAMNYMGKVPEQFVHTCYTRETYLKTYSNVLMPVQGSNMWKKTNKVLVLPPEVTTRPGRPKKARRREPNEVSGNTEKAPRKGMKMRCKKCLKYGHNLRSCGRQPKERGTKSKQNNSGTTSGLNDNARENLHEVPAPENDNLWDVPIANEEADAALWEEIGNSDYYWNLGTQSQTQNDKDGQADPVQTDPSANKNQKDQDGQADPVQTDPSANKNQKDQDGQADPVQIDQTATKKQKLQDEQADPGHVHPKATKKPKLPIRRSARIKNVGPRGPPTVSHVDLTQDDSEQEAELEPETEATQQSTTRHAGLMNAPEEGPSLKKGQFFFKGRFYTTLEALKGMSKK